MLPAPHPSLRDEIAAVAARLIAEDGLDYAGAKRRALREVLGESGAAHAHDCVPDNALVEAAVRAHQALFLSETQPARLLSLRRTAIEVMEYLNEFHPYLTGAVLNGTAGEHSDIHLQVFNDNAKDLEIFLLNAGLDFDVSQCEPARSRGDAVETLSFTWPPRSLLRHSHAPASTTEAVHLTVLDPRDQRSSRAARQERADLRALESLLREPSTAAYERHRSDSA